MDLNNPVLASGLRIGVRLGVRVRVRVRVATQHLPFLRYVLKIVWKFIIGICMEAGFVIYVGVVGMAGKGV
jgi:hypothetical protein